MDEVQRAIGSGTPTEAIACYARWWQLESYVREIVYTELRSAYGTVWAEEVGERASSRAAGDRVNHYMASADAEDVPATPMRAFSSGAVARPCCVFARFPRLTRP